MIDIENLVVSKITQALRAQYGTAYPGLKVYSITPEIPESFPCIVIEMQSNVTTRSTLEFGKPTENHADVVFQVDVYANNGDLRRETAKTLFDFIDLSMQDMGFVRMMATPTPNIDRTIYRITGRYSGRSDSGTTEDVDGKTVTRFLIFK